MAKGKFFGYTVPDLNLGRLYSTVSLSVLSRLCPPLQYFFSFYNFYSQLKLYTHQPPARSMVAGARWAGVSISQTGDQLGFSHTNISVVYRDWFKKRRCPVSTVLCRCQRRMTRLLQAERKETLNDYWLQPR